MIRKIIAAAAIMILTCGCGFRAESEGNRMAIYHENIVSIELESGNIHRSFLKHSIGKADVDANRFGIRAYRNGVPVDLSGASCQGFFRNAEGLNIALTSYGTVSGNEAYVTLPAACYNVEGLFTLAIKLVGGGVTGTMRIVDGMVDNTNTSGAVAPTSSVPTYVEIIAQYDAMVAATAAANTAIAEDFDATKCYPAGKMVINGGTLYKLTEDHEVNTTWANTSKVAAKIANEVSDLAGARSYMSYAGDEMTNDPMHGYFIDENKSIHRGEYSTTGFDLIAIDIVGPTEITFSGYNYNGSPALVAYKRDGSAVQLLPGNEYHDGVVLTINDPDVVKVAGCSLTSDEGKALILKGRSLMFDENANITYIARNVPVVSNGGFEDTGIVYDFARPVYFRITNKGTADGYFRPSIRQDDVAKQDFTAELIAPSCAKTVEMFWANTNGIHGWMGDNKYFTDYEWELYLNSVNSRACVVDVFYYNSDEPLKTDDKGCNIIYVDTVGKNGAFKDISDAVAYAKDKVDVSTTPVTIFIRRGTYNLSPVDSRNAVINKGANRISVIGEDRDTTRIILSSTPAHNNKIIEHGGPSTIANLTMMNLWTEDGSTPDYSHNAYVIHNDIAFTASEKYRTVVKNCCLYSEAFAPVGAGLHDFQEQVYEDCEIVFNCKDPRQNGYNQWGPIYIHPCNIAGEDNCSVVIDNCVCRADSGTLAITLPFGPSGAGDITYADIPVTIRRTIGTTTGATITDVDSRYDLQPDSALNNVQAWNYTN